MEAGRGPRSGMKQSRRTQTAMIVVCILTCLAATARTVLTWHNTPAMPYATAAAALDCPGTTRAERRLAIQVLQATATKIVQQLRDEPSEHEQAEAAIAQIAKAAR